MNDHDRKNGLIKLTNLKSLNGTGIPANELNLTILVQQLRLLHLFRELVINQAIVSNPKKYPNLTDRQKMKAISKEKAHFTQWFYDNLLLKNISFMQDDSPLLSITRFKTGYRSDAIPSEQINKFLEIAGVITTINNKDDNDLAANTQLIPRRFGNYIKINYQGFKLNCLYSMYMLSRERYSGRPELLDQYIFALLAIYQTIEVDNNYLSVPPDVVKLCEFEFFGSPFNTLNPYFGPLPQIERKFGSYGNFFTAAPETINCFSNFYSTRRSLNYFLIRPQLP